MIKKILVALLLLPTLVCAQINTERVMTIARNALYFEDYVLSIQYFNQVINAKPYLYEPYFFRGLAKINLDDFQGAEADCDKAIERNPFVVGAYQIRGLARIRQNKYDGAIEDYKKALPEADIYVYDNNSIDGTDEIAKKAGAIVKYEYRQGKGKFPRQNKTSSY